MVSMITGIVRRAIPGSATKAPVSASVSMVVIAVAAPMLFNGLVA
jgi:hypothetical protein